MKDYGLIEIKNVPNVSSRSVAEHFNKQHKDVLESLRNLAADNVAANSEFWLLNFQESSYKDRGKTYPEYRMTKDGFTLLVMGFTGKKAMAHKIAYINQFNLMEQTIKTRESARLGHPAFTDAIKLAHDPVKHHHFSNESDMINRLVLGMTAKQFKEANGIGKDAQSIRPWLSLQQIAEVEFLQMLDTGMNAAMMTFEQRKMALGFSLMKRREKQLRIA